MTSFINRVSAALAASALVASGLAATTSPSANAAVGECVAPTDTVSVFGFNDFHGRIGSAAQLFTPVEAARTTLGEDNVLLISQGDNIGASLFESMVADDQPTIDILNAIGLDASAVGNHEFDKGWTDLAGRVIPEADFPYLGANVYLAGTEEVAAPLEEYALFDKGGVTIGVVGVVTADTPSLVIPGGVADLDFGDPVAAVNRVTTELLDGNAANGEADIVIASFHEGAADGSATAEANADASDAFGDIYRDVDSRVTAIFNAHTHQVYSWTTASGVPVIQAGQYAQRLARLDLEVDATGGGVCDSTVTILDQREAAVGTSARLSAINAIVTAANAYADEQGTIVIGQASAAISTAGAGDADTRDYESPMSNLVAEMFREVLGDDADDFIGVQNPGGTRDSFDAGPITYREAALTLPFANSLFTTQLTGDQFKEVLEQQWQRAADGSVPSRPFLRLGLSENVSYTYDESRPEGDRITSITVSGVPVDGDKLYTFGGGSFLITGGDNFHTFADGVNTTDTGRADLEAWVEWVGDQGTLSPDYSLRGVAAELPAGPLVKGGPALTYVFGDALEGGVSPQTLDMYLLDGSKVSPALINTTITAYLGGVQVGSGTVTNGVGTISVSLPATSTVAPGQHVLRFVVEASGTEILVPVMVQRAGFVRTAPYTLPGTHNLNGRLWMTTCEPYSRTERCRTEIWATTVRLVDGKYVRTTGWTFNNLTYLPSSKSLWGANPLANTGTYTINGRQWRTECGTPQTGRDGCRSYIFATVVEAYVIKDDVYGYRMANKWVFNNIVMFG